MRNRPPRGMIVVRMHKRWKEGMESAGGVSAVWRRGAFLGAAALFWFEPSSGASSAILAGLGLYGLWNFRKTLSAWRNPAGALLGLGVLWAVLSIAWSFHPAGSARDLVKSAPMALAAFALPAAFDRPSRI